MNEKILIVDDDPRIIAAFKRQMYNRYAVDSAGNGRDGLIMLQEQGPFAVVISDLRMPGLDGIQFFIQARHVAPDTVRIMLTGHADLQTAIDSVNEGNIFRFLTKPCPEELLRKVIDAGIAQHHLIMAERELLENTLSGSVRMMCDMLALANPTAFGRAHRIQRLVSLLERQVEAVNTWEVEMAALLSQVGCITVPEAILQKKAEGRELAPAEQAILQAHPRVAHDLLAHIPRLEGVAAAIYYQDKGFDGSGFPPDDTRTYAIPAAARMLKIVIDFDELESRGLLPQQALAQMRQQAQWYDPDLLQALQVALEQLEGRKRFLLKDVSVRDLSRDMFLAEDVYSQWGLLLVGKGQQVTLPILLRIQNFGAVREPIKVLAPVPEYSEKKMADIAGASPPKLSDQVFAP